MPVYKFSATLEITFQGEIEADNTDDAHEKLEDECDGDSSIFWDRSEFTVDYIRAVTEQEETLWRAREEREKLIRSGQMKLIK